MKVFALFLFLITSTAINGMEETQQEPIDTVKYYKEIHTIFAWRRKPDLQLVLQLSKNILNERLIKNTWKHGESTNCGEYVEDFIALKALIEAEELKLKDQQK